MSKRVPEDYYANVLSLTGMSFFIPRLALPENIALELIFVFQLGYPTYVSYLGLAKRV